MTSQIEPYPHEPMQGSLHFPFMHAKFRGHSEFIEHSGLQDGGTPIKSDKQEHTGELLIIRHWEFGPQGEGVQEGGLSVVDSSRYAMIDKENELNNFFSIFERREVGIKVGFKGLRKRKCKLNILLI